MAKFNLYKKYGSDANKELNGVPFYLDKDSDTYITVGRWTGRNIEHTKAQVELTRQSQNYTEEQLNDKRRELFCQYLIKGWNNIFDREGKELPFTVENAIALMTDLPDLFDEVVAFSMERENYPLDGVDFVAKN